MKNHVLIAALIIASATPVGLAQDAENGERGDRRRGERRARGEARRGGDRGPRFDRMFDRIAESLQLDEEQIRQFEEIRAEQRERMEEFRERRQAIREARDAGNDELAEQLRAEFQADREERGGFGGMMHQMRESLDPILTEEQRGLLAEMRDRNRGRWARRGRGEGEGRREGFGWGRMFDDMPEELELNEEQTQQFEEIRAEQRERREEFWQRRQAIGEARDAGNDELADKLRAEFRADMEEGGGMRGARRRTMEAFDEILTDEQRARLAEMRQGDRNWGNRNRGDSTERERRARVEERDELVEGRQQQGEAGRRERGEGPQRNPVQQMWETLPDRLQLDDGQRGQYAAMLEADRQQARKIQAKVGTLREQLNEARESNDQARVEALQEQIEALELEAAARQEALLKRLEGTLRADQHLLLTEYRDEMRFERELEEIPVDLRAVLRAATRVRLSKEQKTQFKKIYNDARKAWREARQADRKNRSREKAAETALAAKTKARIVRMLNEQQIEKYQEQLKRLSRKSKRGASRNKEI